MDGRQSCDIRSTQDAVARRSREKDSKEGGSAPGGQQLHKHGVVEKNVPYLWGEKVSGLDLLLASGKDPLNRYVL